METSLSVIILIGEKVDKVLYKKCLASVSWADEIVKIETKNEKGGFSDWRNLGFKKATKDWILYIDTDEEVTKELEREIKKVISNSTIKNSSYAIPRKNIIFGKEFKHGGQYPDYQKRLFLKKDFIKWFGNLHEEPKFKGNLGLLKNPIIHHKDLNINQMLEKTNMWSEIEGQLMFDTNHPQMNIIRFFSAGIREFYLRMIKQRAFLDGAKGVIYAFYQVYSRLISYSKLWEKQQSTTRI
ncbi:MAG: glycosyltransferase family 2 protein [bacterium]|nr:glycosyltransferase family 2 protein [bacterium]